MKFVAWLIFSFLLFAGAYWYKCYLRIDLFPAFSLSKYLPEPIRKVVRPDRIFKDEVGVIFHDDFDHSGSLKNWVEVPKKKNEDFSYALGVDVLNHTRCLSVVNRSNNVWSLQEHQLIEVTEDDEINFEGNIRINNILSKSSLGMILFNKDYHVLTVDYVIPDSLSEYLWKHASLKFKVPKDVFFLRLMLNGYGQESVLFDDVKVSRGKM